MSVAVYRYGRLYRAMMSDGALSFAGFFFFFLIHTLFCIWSAVAPSFIQNGQDYAHTGWLPALQLFKDDGGGSKFAAICYSIGMSLMLLQAALLLACFWNTALLQVLSQKTPYDF
jgi:secretory carrier-associated membrane protein